MDLRRGVILAIVSGLIFTQILVSAVESYSEENINYGDVNGDENVNSIDFATMRLFLLGKIKEFPGGENGVKAADLNLDERFNSIDFAYMRLYLLGKIKSLPVGVPTPTITPNEPETTPICSKQSVFMCSTNKEITFSLNANSIKESAYYRYRITYNPNELEVIDLCCETFNNENSTCNIPEADIQIVQHSNSDGMIIFDKLVSVEDGTTYTGSLNSIRFKSKKDSGTSVISYTVEKSMRNIVQISSGSSTLALDVERYGRGVKMILEN